MSQVITMDPAVAARAQALIRDVPDFPKPGILFRDITPLLANAAVFRAVTEAMAAPYSNSGITHVVGIESRGFIVGVPVAQILGVAFVPARKPGKLPARVVQEEYALEYGSDALEIHADALGPEARALVVDDVLATGGTAAAACRLVERTGARVIGCAFLIALSALGGRTALGSRDAAALVTY